MIASREYVSQSPIKLDESVIFFPTYGTLDEAAAHWTVRVHGWIFEPSLLGSLALAAFRLSLDLPMDRARDEIFRDRARPFVVDNERNKAIPITFKLDAEPEIVVLEKSAPNGHFHDRIEIPCDHLNATHGAALAEVAFDAVVQAADPRKFSGQVKLIHPEGISVITDIDDTIKISDVTDQQELLRNTFMRPFEAVPAIAERYAAWQAEAEIAPAFHYVTAAPWQLYQPLSGFLHAEDFPAGTMHMKNFRVKDSSVFNLFRNQTVHKTEAIGQILRDFPKRRFVMVGDAGEQDPEVYGAIARSYPEQVCAIFIRNFQGLKRSDARFEAAFDQVAAERWHFFQDGHDLPESLSGLQQS